MYLSWYWQVILPFLWRCLCPAHIVR